MRVLVTGGAGFIGARLSEFLVGAGHEVVVVDDLSTGEEGAVPPGSNLIRIDIADSRTAKLVAELAPAAIFHAAAQVSVPRSMVDPIRDLAVNVRGTVNVIQGAREAGVERFVFLSSGGAAYGNVARATGASESTPVHPLSPYGIHKLAAERHVGISGLGWAVARLANVYGPGQRSDLEGGVAAIFAERARARLDLEIHGSGEQTRDFVHVDDVVDALIAMLHSRLNETWNVGTGRATSITDLARIVQAASPGIGIGRSPARDGDVRSSLLNIAKIRKDLGWRPTHDLNAEMSRLIRTV